MSVHTTYHSGRTQSKRRVFSRKHHGDSRDLQCEHSKAVMGADVRKQMKRNLNKAQRRNADSDLREGLQEFFSAGDVKTITRSF